MSYFSVPDANYVLQFLNGKYYSGRVNSDAEPNAWQCDNASDAFGYSKEGAENQKNLFFCFKDCIIIQWRK